MTTTSVDVDISARPATTRDRLGNLYIRLAPSSLSRSIYPQDRRELKKLKITCLTLCALLLLAANVLFADPRNVVDLDAGWCHIRQDAAGAEAPAFEDGAWQQVNLPHSWNCQDGQNAGAFYRGPGWYRRHFRADAAWAGKRIYVRFGAASTCAEVFVNGQQVGSHKGAFSAFCFDVTPFVNLGADNVLAVRVTNEKDPDVAPLSCDFNMNGGLYRNADLVIVSPVGVSMLDEGSNGVYVRQDNISSEKADLTITTVVRNAGSADQTATIRCQVGDALVQTTQTIAAGASVNVEQRLVIMHPHLWNGLRDPFLYPVHVSVSGAAGADDSVDDKVGLRFFRVDPEKGFFLNGSSYRLYGVNRHQDKQDKAWAISPEDESADFANIMDLGCTAVRLAHYQQSLSFYGLCDAAGVIVWAEVPLVNQVTAGSTAFESNTLQQLRELIKQNYNHPSICFWSLYNELNYAKEQREAQVTLVTQMNDTAHHLDPTRLTTCASNLPFAFQRLSSIADLTAYNEYTGWYGHETMDKWPDMLDTMRNAHCPKPCGISEYGAGASVVQHQAEPVARTSIVGSWHPEEYQADLHEHAWAAIKSEPWLWCSFIWCLHDFASHRRNEGDHAARNDKGLVTYDGKTRKDAFYFYQANWSPKSMVYIADRRFTPRPDSVCDIKVYSNCDTVYLMVNGEKLQAAAPSDIHVLVWPSVQLKAGENRIEAIGTRRGATVKDACTIVVNPAAN